MGKMRIALSLFLCIGISCFVFKGLKELDVTAFVHGALTTAAFFLTGIACFIVVAVQEDK